MKVLVVSDKVEPILYGPGIMQRAGDVDMVLSCGDLPFYYLEYIVSMINKPTYYVFGNHGREIEYQSGRHGDWQEKRSPGGAVNLHCRTAKEGPLLLAGLEGSMRYNNAPRYQYTDRAMWNNVMRLIPNLMANRSRYGRYLDVLVAHSPPYGIHDESDLPHTGFRSFLKFMRWFKPRYLLHGHIHLYRRDIVTRTQFYGTEVINVYPYQILDLEPVQQ